MSLQLSDNNNDEEEFTINPENLLKDGIDIIYKSFNSNIENYIEQIEELKKTINDLNKKLELMKEEIEMIQRENEYYKTQNKKLKNEVNNMNKVVNNIKGKLINFDVNLNSKQIIEDINQEYLTSKAYNKYNSKNNIKKEYNNIFKRNQSNRNYELSRNSNTMRYDTKNLNKKDIIYNIEINNPNNDDILSEINSGNNIINYYDDRKMNTLNNELNAKNSNILNHKNFNDENSKNNYYSNKNICIEHSYFNKRNINFNSYKNINTYRRKNKIKNNSFNFFIPKEKIKDDIKYLIRNNNNEIISKRKGYLKLNEEPLLDSSDNFYYGNQTCKTFQNIKNRNSINNTIFIKELKKKEISFFIKKCREHLEKEDFEIIFQIYQKYKEEIIKDKNIIKQIKIYLKQNEELLNLFNNIIS